MTIIAALSAFALAAWAAARTAYMSSATPAGDRFAVIMICVGSFGCGGYLLAGMYIPPFIISTLFVGLSWWIGVGTFRNWLSTKQGSIAKFALSQIDKLTGAKG